MSATYDVVLYGATGFTGKLVAQYLATHPQQPKIAFAGRSTSKVQTVIESLTDVSAERVKSIGVLEASANNYSSLQRLAASARVIINTVGPYAHLGGYDVIRAAIEAGIGYVDLTGETGFYGRVAQELHEQAQATKAVIVPSSGFDSLPFDLTTYLAAQEIRNAYPDATVSQAICAYKMKGGISGGTIASAVSMRTDPDQMLVVKPYWFSPVTGSAPNQNSIIKMPQVGKYGISSPFTPHNTRIVYRTWGLLESGDPKRAYGPSFVYNEGLITRSAVGARIMAFIFALVNWLIINVALFGQFLKSATPQGTGPSVEKQINGSVYLRTLAESRNSNVRAIAEFKAKGDPGYLNTSRLIAETALAIAFDKERLSSLAQAGGVLTPSALGGEIVASRLGTYAGITIKSAIVPNNVDLTTPL
ncbi:hypothetical protein MCUN1_001740 [Malassezia cuniculi]|uniref:Saccharopine dehydrogenase NADP binding domain-containing protein n=1 Tax=Malassezia cuniculi TaxID=948313 RepID=A0AAF0ETE1_9BASI|nr:hypothetical protein MCUN1_001740 [Malassezia cuniculi]